MPERRRTESNPPSSRRRRAATPEGREAQLIAKAERLAERQLSDGTASAQVITHYLKLGSTREQLEKERMLGDIELQKAKIEQLASGKRIEELYVDAIKAMRTYSGSEPEVDGE